MNSSSILNPIEELKKIYHTETVEFFKPAVKPIYTKNEDEILAFIGSGILLNIKNIKCLATAAHVIDECVDSEIFIPSGDKLHKISVNGFCTVPPDGVRSKDDFDYAICVLSENEVKNFKDSKFINEAYISDKISKSRFTVIGYPKSKNKFNVPLKKAEGGFYAYTSNQIRKESYYYYLEHEKVSINQAGKKFDNPISLYGMSGGVLIDLNIHSWEEIIDKSEAKSTTGKLIGLVIEKTTNDKKNEEIKAISLDMIIHSIKTKL